MLGMVTRVKQIVTIKWSFGCLTALFILISVFVSGCQGTGVQNQIPTEVAGSIKTNGYKLKVVQKGSTAGQLQIVYEPTGEVIDATIDVSCANGKSATISTRNNQGTCEVEIDANHNVIDGICYDSHGNGATYDCALGSCGDAKGSGSCKNKQ